MSDLNDIRDMLQDGDLQQRIVRSLGSSTVALFAVSQSQKGTDFLTLAGTGTLAFVDGLYGIVTAAHVWEEVLKSALKLGITLTEKIDHRYLIDISTVIPTMMRAATEWSEWGPDIAFLRIPFEFVGEIEAFQVFEDLKKPPKRLGVESLECWFSMGTPKELGSFTETHASIEISGGLVDPQAQSGGEYDYYDFEVNTEPANMPKNFQGFSGGGLWRVPIYYSPLTGKVDWAQRLKRVIFWQFPLVEGRRTIRCHGPNSILAVAQRATSAPTSTT